MWPQPKAEGRFECLVDPGDVQWVTVLKQAILMRLCLPSKVENVSFPPRPSDLKTLASKKERLYTG